MLAGEILELNTFLAVAEEGRFASAAVRLGVTPSAISQSIRRLEARLGTRLFSRTTRSVGLTEAGEALLLEVKPALDRLADAERILANRRRSGGRARISVSAVAMDQLIAPILVDFRNTHPDFHLEIVVEDRLVDPVAHRYDAAIRRGDLLPLDMVARRLSRDDRLILVASPAYLEARKPFEHPREIVQNRIVIRRPRSGAILPWSLSCLEEAVSLKGNAALVTESAITAREHAMSGLGVAFLAHDFVAGRLRDGSLNWILPDWTSPLAGFHLMYPHRGTMPDRLNAFVKQLLISL